MMLKMMPTFFWLHAKAKTSQEFKLERFDFEPACFPHRFSKDSDLLIYMYMMCFLL